MPLLLSEKNIYSITVLRDQEISARVSLGCLNVSKCALHEPNPLISIALTPLPPLTASSHSMMLVRNGQTRVKPESSVVVREIFQSAFVALN